jgi:cytoskeleton protein RodZ
MESVGHTLREARSRLGLTLEQVRTDTRISLKNLAAIEADDLSGMSSPFFYKSFVRQFAAKVNVDYDSIACAVQEAAARMPEPLVPGQEEVQTIHVARLKPKRHIDLKWLRSLASFCFVIATGSMMYAAWQSSHANWHVMLSGITDVTGRVRAAASAASAAFNAPSAADPRPASISTPAGKPEAATGNEANKISSPRVVQPIPDFHVRLSAIERTWLSIVADGKPTFSGVLHASEIKMFEGHEFARIRTGNAGGLSFTFNGKEIGILGPRGQIRTVVFTKDYYEVLPTAPQIAFAGFIPNGE